MGAVGAGDLAAQPRRREAPCRGSTSPFGSNARRSGCIVSRSSSPNISGIEHALSVPTPCSPVSEPPASMHASRISLGELLGPLRLALDRAVVEDERVEVAVAGVEDVADPEAVLGRELVDPPQHLGQLRARHDAVLDVVVGADPAHRGEGGLAPAPDRARARPRPRRCGARSAPFARQISSTAARSSSTCGGDAVELDDQHRAAPGGYPAPTAASAASIVSASIISIAAGMIPAAIDAARPRRRPRRWRRSRRAASAPPPAAAAPAASARSRSRASPRSRRRRRAGRGPRRRATSETSSPSGSTTVAASTWLTVKPYFRQWAPPEFSATLPPIVQTCWLDGSGA